MTLANSCPHQIKILNLDQQDVVTYPITRVVGVVTYTETEKCQEEDGFIMLTIQPQNSSRTIRPTAGTFKFVLELQEGENNFSLHFGCQTLTFNLSYCPATCDFSVMPLYVICEGHDGAFQGPRGQENDSQSACKRIELCSKLLQCFTAEKLYENGFSRKTFRLEDRCQIFNSKLSYLEARKMTQEQLWENIGREIMNSDIASQKRKYLAFLSCTRYIGERFSEDVRSHADALKITEGYVALGGGGLALFGSASLHTWPERFEDIISKLDDQTPIDKTKFLDDSCYRGTAGACFSTTLGSVLHELYHTFDLGHTDEGVMGRGFDNIANFFTSREMPKEDTTSSYGTRIEFKEELVSAVLSERLDSEHKKKDVQVIRRYEDNDRTVLTRSCAVILAYHKWFNSRHFPAILEFDQSSKFIKSTAGIRVVEVRELPEERINCFWTFEGKVLKYSFSIPEEVFAAKLPLMLFVEDNWGNLLKKLL